MSLIATVSTAEAAAALGLRPVTVCKMIRTGQLPAARIGRSWRVGLTGLNALLAGANGPAASSVPRPSVVSELPTMSPRTMQIDGPPLASSLSPTAGDRSSTVQNDIPAQPSPVVSEQTSPSLPQSDSPVQARPDDGFDADDMVWVRRYRRDLSDPDPQIRADAKGHLEQFARRAEQVKRDRLRQMMRHQSPEACQSMARAMVASSPPSRSAWW